MPDPEWRSLRDALGAAGGHGDATLHGDGTAVALSTLAGQPPFAGGAEALRGRSVLIATRGQAAAAAALVALDGIARRIVLCPPDVPAEHVPLLMADAAVDAVVSDGGVETLGPPHDPPNAGDRTAGDRTEWVLLTSGTTGRPKLAVHTLSGLAGAIRPGPAAAARRVWSTFYDIRRYGGLQIFLRAVLGGGSLVLSEAGRTLDDVLVRAGAAGVTHISGTPSHWRCALMSPALHAIAPGYIRLSGEIADQAILDALRAAFPKAAVTHAFASTEAGVAFDVDDGLAGFPASLIGRADAEVEMRIDDGSLRIRSARTALRYLGDGCGPLADDDGFVDTGDMVEQRGDRFHFVGRRGGIINVGGLKVHPEEVEAVINRHPGVRMSRVTARRSPITGSLVVAEVLMATVCDGTPEPEALKEEILGACRRSLTPHKVPVSVRFVPHLAVSASGKLARPHA